MPPTRLAYLFQRYYNKTATNQEAAEFMELLTHKDREAAIKELMGKTWDEAGDSESDDSGSDKSRFGGSGFSPGFIFTPDQSASMLRAALGIVSAPETASIQAGDPSAQTQIHTRSEAGSLSEVPQAPVHRILPGRSIWRRASAAAAVLLLIAAGTWYWTRPHTPAAGAPIAGHLSGPKEDVAPGGNKAVLTLGDGSTITLDSAREGALALQGNTRVLKVASGRLAYRLSAEARQTAPPGSQTALAAAPLTYNMISTPRGGQYEVLLPDGSKAWLNASSSLRFPTAFSGADRIVELTGEGYFEVAANSRQPFKVKAGEAEIDVLGTHFNVMAYSDEPALKTSLLEGAVKVVQGRRSGLLKAGEAASLDRSTGDIGIAPADTDQAVAWKNGRFEFDGADIKTVMRQVARWYDVQVVYEGDISRHFSGLIRRSSTLSEMLKILELTGKARFRLEGRTVLVSPVK